MIKPTDTRIIVRLKETDKTAIEYVHGLAAVVRRYCCFARDASGEVYRCNLSGGYYMKQGEAFLTKLVMSMMRLYAPEKYTSHKVKEVIKYLTDDAPMLLDRPPMNRLNLLNGIFNLETGELEPHSYKYLSAVQLPINYDPEATCPAWEKFICETFPADSQDL